MLETKYGKIIRATPHASGTTVFWRLPYTKKPSPIEPNSNPQRRDDVSNAVVKSLSNGEVEGPHTGVGLEPRVHTVFRRPRRHYRDSRPAPAIVRGPALIEPSESFRSLHQRKIF